MPFYTFENKTTGEVYTESMPMAERESYLKEVKTRNAVEKWRRKRAADKNK